MSLTQLKDQAAHLPFREQRELIAYIISIQTDENEQFKRFLTDKIDDKNLSNWVELDDIPKRFSE